MRFTAYYLIEARPELESVAHAHPELSLPELLLDPVVLSHEEGGRRAASNSEQAHVVKLLFLAQIREYDTLDDDATFARIFGSPRLNAVLFDRWWTIRRLECDGSAESLVPLLERVGHLVDGGDSDYVNDWLKHRLGRST